MKRYGLIGKPLGHSLSQRWFEEQFRQKGVSDAQYRLYELDSTKGLREWVLANMLDGFNVTIPYKEEVISHLDETDDIARSIGAVNCVEVNNGHLIGHNTDAPAFQLTLQHLLQPHHSASLILGTGGAAKAVAYALGQLGICHFMVSRHPDSHPGSVSYSEAEALLSDHFLLINATPVGTFPDTISTPWPRPDLITARHLCYDLVYNPPQTRFLSDARHRGAATCNGLEMLTTQAQLSWNIWGIER